MKRGGFLPRYTPIKCKSHSESAEYKDAIQAELRRIVIKRDGGCILRDLPYRDYPECGGFRKDGEPILQADHLITRGNNATYPDPRLVVCLCRDHHAWKSTGSNARKAEYDALVRTLLPADRVKLWDAAEQDSWRPHRKYAYDWRVELAYLKTL